MRTLTRSVERGHPGPRSTSRAQLRMSGLTPPPEGSSCRPLVRPLSSSPSASSPTFRMQFLGITFRADTKTAKYQRLIFNPSNTHRGIACEIVGNPQGGLVAATVSRSQAVRPTASAPPDAYQHLPPPAARLIPTPPATRRPRMLPRATRPVRAASASRRPPPENAPPGNNTRTERT